MKNEQNPQHVELLEEAMALAKKHADDARDVTAADVNTPAMEELLAWNRQVLDSATALSHQFITFSKAYRKERQHIHIHEAATAELLRERDALKAVVTQLIDEKKALRAENNALRKTLESPAEVEVEGLPAEAYLTDEFIGDFEKVRKVPVIVEAATIKKEIVIATREGTLKGYPGDKLMRGVELELYPCGKAIFEATYEYVSEDEAEDDDDGNGTGD